MTRPLMSLEDSYRGEKMVTSRAVNLSGVMPALVTPFSEGGREVDTTSLGNLLDYQLAAGVDGVVVCGSTGEASTLTDSEYTEVVRFVRTHVKGRVPCIAGISVSSTARAVQMAQSAREIGCDGVLVATPPYNKPSQGGIIEHFRAIHAAVGMPIVAYNIPGRSGVAISSATLGALSREGVIVGVKESSGSVDTIADTLLAVTPECKVLSGEDSLFLATLAYGGSGIISATANALPREFVSIYRAFRANDCEGAGKIQMEILPRIRTAFCESNPVPIKAALAMRGVIKSGAVRLPLISLSPENLARVQRDFSL